MPWQADTPGHGPQPEAEIDGRRRKLGASKSDNGAEAHRSCTGPSLLRPAIEPRELTYEVARDGRIMGGGRMMLVDDGSAWVDLTWGKEGPGYGAELVYEKLGRR